LIFSEISRGGLGLPSDFRPPLLRREAFYETQAIEEEGERWPVKE
jgi:hypothetical protein